MNEYDILIIDISNITTEKLKNEIIPKIKELNLDYYYNITNDF